ncbi:histidine kinase [Pedobacter sp. KR3-3]|uniref:Histidine kinase n=1 Tax=Pedobacter albus TaxID=3113905 RepID=A0ABU7IAF3_9SPHI|nr:histidine kinase [Pedobacter sp. KR3-3]MEE1946342.1 histidine kinase [Pedobacter sp. KR3-3]
MKRLCFIFVLILLASCKHSTVVYEASEPRFRMGDDRLWAHKNYADANWETARGFTEDKVFWVRFNMDLKERPDPQTPLGLQVYSFGAFEVYWDGVCLGHNGELAQSGKPEVPGTETTAYLVPDSLASKGRHLIALRTTQSFKKTEQRGVNVKLQDYPDLLRSSLLTTSYMNLIAGAFLIACIYYFFLYINSRRKQYPVLIFAVICFFFFALLILEYVKFYVDIPYTYFYVRLEAIGWITFLLAFLVPLYFCLQFGFKRKGWLLGLLLCVLVAIYIAKFGHYDTTAIYYSYTMWMVTVLVVIDAVVRKEKGAWVVLIGLISRVVINYFFYYDFSLFISFAIVVLCMLYLHAIRTRMIEEEHEASLLLSARLQLDLVKKNIQPHFLKNTLLSLIDWVEESPQQGVKFLHSLSNEFDIMNSIAEEALIPVRKEIELCQAHLSVMQFRKEIAYQWQEQGIVDTELVPPALFHTLLENGITHSMPIDGQIRFKLSFSLVNGYKAYVFETFALNRIKSGTRVGGNGLNYIKARLTESYGQHWEFASVATATGWQSTIKIKDAP